jgi:hypothetical protein
MGFFALRVFFHPRGESLESGFMEVVLEIVELNGAFVSLLETGLNHEFVAKENNIFEYIKRIKTSLLIKFIQG